MTVSVSWRPGARNINSNNIRPRILLVDDESSNQKMMQRLLTGVFNCECMLASNGELAIQIITKHNINNNEVKIIH